MNYKILFIAALLLLVPVIFLAGIWPSLPAIVPLHSDFNGKVDRYGNKNEVAVVTVVLGVVSLVLFLLLSNIHRLTKWAPVKNKSRMQNIALAVLALMTIVQCWLLHIIQSSTFTGSIKLILAAMFLLFAVIGNYMPNLKPNYVAGFRLPWTLNNKDNWRKTHQLAGRFWVAGGLACAALCLLLPFKAALVAAGILFFGMLLLPAIYSYKLFKQGS